MMENLKSAVVRDNVKTTELFVENGIGRVDLGCTYELTEQYTVATANILRYFPDEYNFFSGRMWQLNKRNEKEYFPISKIIVEFFVGATPYYVAGENFHESVKAAMLMQSYIRMHTKTK